MGIATKRGAEIAALATTILIGSGYGCGSASKGDGALATSETERQRQAAEAKAMEERYRDSAASRPGEGPPGMEELYLKEAKEQAAQKKAAARAVKR